MICAFNRIFVESIIYMYIPVYPSRHLIWNDKIIRISTHAVIRAIDREVTLPEQLLETIHKGKVRRFGKRGIKFISRKRQNRIICVGEDLGHEIVIKTIERG